jgi:outer membrane protein
MDSRMLTLALALAGLAAAGSPAAGQEARTLSLEEAIRLSLAHDPAAVAAEAGVASAEATLLQARGSWLPTISANGIYGNSSNQRFDQTSGRLVSENYTAQLQGSYEVFGGGRRLAQNRSASAALGAAEAGSRAERYGTVLRTTEAFYAAAAARELVEAAQQRLARARQQLEFARTRLEGGTPTPSEALRAETEVGDAELAVLEAESEQQSAAQELGRRVGLAVRVRPEARALPSDAPTLPPTAELVARALSSAPTVLAAHATRRSRRAARLAAYTPYLPSLRLTGGYDWFAFEFPPDQRSWSLRLFASWPLFNGFQREAALAQAAAAERVAEARASDAELGVRLEVETAVREVALADRRITISDRTVELAQEDLRVQEERYQINAATILELQASQLALAEAEIAGIQARQALGVAVARLETVLGDEIGGVR